MSLVFLKGPKKRSREATIESPLMLHRLNDEAGTPEHGNTKGGEKKVLHDAYDVRMCTNEHIHMYLYIYMYAYLHTHLYQCKQVDVQMYIYILLYVYFISVHIYI